MLMEVTSILFKDFVNDGPVPVDNFVATTRTFSPDDLKDSEILVQLLYLSVDPYMRMQMKDTKVWYHSGYCSYILFTSMGNIVSTSATSNACSV